MGMNLLFSKKRYSLLSLFSLTLLLLTSCGGGGKGVSHHQEGDTLALRHASFLSIKEYKDYSLVQLRNPWDLTRQLHTYQLVPEGAELPQPIPGATVIRIPLRHSLFFTSIHCSLLHELGASEAVSGVCDLKYIQLPFVKQGVAQGRIRDCGDAMSPDIERIIDLNPDAILLSPFENSGGYGRIEKLGIPLVECADYMETSPLARAEWMRFYGRLYGKGREADSLFLAVEQRYLELKKRAMQTENRPTVLCELKSSSAWYIPGGKSTTGQLCNDAGGCYLFAEDTHPGSVPLSFETVYHRAADADVWLFKYNQPYEMSYELLKKEFAGYAAFRPFKEQRIFCCHTGRRPFYEETPFRPDLLLEDFIQILHPEIAQSDSLRYFCPLKP